MDQEEVEDFLTQGYWNISPRRRQTRKACIEVLTRLPADLTEKIVYLGTFTVLIAPEKEWGWTLPLTFPYNLQPIPIKPVRGTVHQGGKSREDILSAQVCTVKISVIYLSPELEEQPHPVIVAVVAHELAHAISRQIEGVESEQLADELILQWGFGEELAALRDANRHHRF